MSDTRITILRRFFENELRKCVSYLRWITLLKPIVLLVFVVYLGFCVAIMVRSVAETQSNHNVGEILALASSLLAIVFVLFFAESKIAYCRSIFDLVLAELDEDLEHQPPEIVADAFRGKLDYLDCRSKAVESVLGQVFKGKL